jgi:UDP-hydrolysing UDP-N-acetyl-D-glucosamine 2-epimerase
MKKIVYISGTRADYGLMRRTLLTLKNNCDLTVLATEMHLNPIYGETINLIKKDGLKVEIINVQTNDDTLIEMVKKIGEYIEGISEALNKIRPNLILVEGDRGESLAAAIAGAHLNIPIIHHGGGDRSGSIDDKIRDAITSFSDYHLAGNTRSYNRLLRMKSKKNVYLVGEPGLDDVYESNYTPKEVIITKYEIDSRESLIVLLQHPDTTENNDINKDMKEILDAIQEINLQTITVYSNSDAGGKKINQIIKKYSKNNPKIKNYANIERSDFLGLMNVAGVMVGNSSSGLIELPSFHKPFVLIGNRQRNRVEAANVIRVKPIKKEIINGLNIALFNENFKKTLFSVENPYRFGNASEKIVKIITDILEKK